MNCPNCDTERPEQELMPANSARRCTRFDVCDCGAMIRLATAEGWERWYATHWSAFQPSEMAWHRLSEADEFYARWNAEHPS